MPLSISILWPQLIGLPWWLIIFELLVHFLVFLIEICSKLPWENLSVVVIILVMQFKQCIGIKSTLNFVVATLVIYITQM